MSNTKLGKTVLIVGAGVGGLAAAIHLARRGYRVQVVEKCEQPGGRVGQLLLGPYRFDVGATIFLMPELYGRAFASLGERMEDHLELRRLDTNYEIHFPDHTRLRLTSDLQRMGAQMEAIESGSTESMLRYLADGAFHYSQSLDHIVSRPFRRAQDFFTPANMLRFLRIRALVPHYGYVRRFFRDSRLQLAFTFHDMYMGLSPRESPATYSLMQYSELAHGLWYPMGGMRRIVEVLVAIAGKYNVEIECNAPVEKILLSERKRATGAVLQDGRKFKADIVLANADLGYAYRDLLPESGAARRVQRMEYGCSTMMFYWGLDSQFPGLGVHNLFFSGDAWNHFECLHTGGGCPAEPNFYIHAPTRMDPSLAPAGHDAWVVAVPVGNMRGVPDQNWPALQTRLRAFILDRLSQAGWPDVAAHITREAVFGPPDWQRRFNLPFGANHGLSHRLTQMGYLRPANRHAQIENLYFVGASTHPGTGIPMVLSSAEFVAQRIQDEAA
jgi:phytoene desaturase